MHSIDAAYCDSCHTMTCHTSCRGLCVLCVGLQKRLNQSRCLSGRWLMWAQGIMHWMGTRSDESISFRESSQGGDAAFHQNSWTTY